MNIFLDYLKVTHFPKNLEQGQTSAKVFRENEVSAFVIAEFCEKKLADKVKIMNSPEINELKTNLKIRSFEGPVEYFIDKKND